MSKIEFKFSEYHSVLQQASVVQWLAQLPSKQLTRVRFPADAFLPFYMNNLLTLNTDSIKRSSERGLLVGELLISLVSCQVNNPVLSTKVFRFYILIIIIMLLLCHIHMYISQHQCIKARCLQNGAIVEISGSLSVKKFAEAKFVNQNIFW